MTLLRIAPVALAVSIACSIPCPTAAGPTNTLSEEEKSQGFKLLFDGTRESFHRNFVDYNRGDSLSDTLSPDWQLLDSVQAMGLPRGNARDVRSRRKYKDFELRLDYRNDAYQGIFYRHLLTHYAAWETGFEFSVLDGGICFNECAGATFDLYSPRVQVYRRFSTGEWNKVRIRVVGDSVEQWMNGTQVTGFRIFSEGFWKAYRRSKWFSQKVLAFKVPGDSAAGFIEEGYIGFQGDQGGKWQIRNLRILEITGATGIRPAPARLPAPRRRTRGKAPWIWEVPGNPAGIDARGRRAGILPDVTAPR